eukprot:9971070-Alexandrium_andersonii.AAC.1
MGACGALDALIGRSVGAEMPGHASKAGARAFREVLLEPSAAAPHQACKSRGMHRKVQGVLAST